MNYIVSLIVVLLFSLLTWPTNGEVIGLWGFDEQTGQVAKDNSPLENDGKIAADVKRVPGKFGRAIEVGGPKKDVVIPMIDEYNEGQANMTFECWVYPLAVKPIRYNQLIITGRGEWGKDDPGAFQLGLTLDGVKPVARWFFRVGGWSTLKGGPEIKEKQWYHFAGTLKDGINATLYVNAEKVMELKLPQKLQENPHPIYVGSWGPGSTEIDAFHGYIDELRFSDEVLEPDELGFSGTLLDVYPERKLTTKWATLKKEQ